MSVPVERIFSGGCDLISKKRCSLGSNSIQACMCLKNWLKHENIIQSFNLQEE